jgi:glycosyltransferase involved in cell wall biosynthesis
MQDLAYNLRHSLVSIVVPVFNAEPFLERCVRSVLSQSYRDLELILVDDGSTDRSAALCNGYCQADKRVRLICQSNGGPSAARNAGLRQACGEFLYFLDADDEMSPDALAILLDLAVEHKADWIAGGFRKQRQDGENNDVVFTEGLLVGHEEILACAQKYLLRPNRYELFSYSWGRLYRTEIIRRHDIRYSEQLFTYEDVEFNFHYLQHANAIYAADNVLYVHHVHDNYTSSRTMFGSTPMRLMGHIDMLETMRTFAGQGKAGLPEEVDVNLKHALIYLTIIQFVRLCGRLSISTFLPIHDAVGQVVRDKRIRSALSYYRPLSGDSRWIPRLMRWRLVIPVLLLSYYKAYRRYRLQPTQPGR